MSIKQTKIWRTIICKGAVPLKDLIIFTGMTTTQKKNLHQALKMTDNIPNYSEVLESRRSFISWKPGEVANFSKDGFYSKTLWTKFITEMLLKFRVSKILRSKLYLTITYFQCARTDQVFIRRVHKRCYFRRCTKYKVRKLLSCHIDMISSLLRPHI